MRPSLPPGNLPPDTPVTGQQAGLTIRRLTEHLHELDGADLTVAGGDQVTIVCVSEVSGWLYGLAIRAEAGELL